MERAGMPIKTTLEQIEEVQTAISAVLNGQAYSIAGRSLTRADLADLTAREEALLKRYNDETGRRPYLNIGTLRRDD